MIARIVTGIGIDNNSAFVTAGDYSQILAVKVGLAAEILLYFNFNHHSSTLLKTRTTRCQAIHELLPTIREGLYPYSLTTLPTV